MRTIGSLIVVTLLSFSTFASGLNQGQYDTLKKAGYSLDKAMNENAIDEPFFEEKALDNTLEVEESRKAYAKPPYLATTELDKYISNTIVGPVGLITTPSSQVLERGVTNAGFYYHPIEINGVSSNASYLSVNHGVSNAMEIGVTLIKTGLKDKRDPDPYFSGKVRIDNVTSFGMTIDTSNDRDDFKYQSSAYLIRSWDKFYIGAGANIYSKSTMGYFSHFGTATNKGSTKGFIFGGAVFPIHEHAALMADFNGDFLSAGIRMQSGSASFDISMLNKGNNAAVIPFKDNKCTVFGVSYKF